MVDYRGSGFGSYWICRHSMAQRGDRGIGGLEKQQWLEFQQFLYRYDRSGLEFGSCCRSVRQRSIGVDLEKSEFRRSGCLATEQQRGERSEQSWCSTSELDHGRLWRFQW